MSIYKKEFLLILALVIISILFVQFGPHRKNLQEKRTSLITAFGSKEKIKRQQVIYTKETKSIKQTNNVLLSDFLKDKIYTNIQDFTVDNTGQSIKSNLNELKKYGNSVGEINDKYLPKTLNKAEILNKFLNEPENLNARNKLLYLSKQYINLSNELLFLNVPPSVLLFHKDFVNIHKTIGDALKKLSESSVTRKNILTYNKSVSKYIDVYLNLAQYLRANGVYFNEYEQGSLFTLPF